MTKPHSPLLGFNTNIRHKGKVFHIQTEDSGVKHPHVITHLFADGGRILKSVKTSYAEHLGSDNLADKIRELMKEQHKAMFIALRDGSFDEVIEQLGSSMDMAAVRPPVAPPPPPVPPVAPPPAPANPGPAPRPNAPAPEQARQAPALAARKPLAGQPQREIQVDIEVLERAAVEQQGKQPALSASQDMPPPPAALQAKRPGGGYRAVSSAPAQPAPSASASRYVASRPAAIFASSRPSEKGNVFGEDLISDKSLDEVILSFLSDEVDAAEPDPKKR